MLTNKTAFVTGGSGALGASICLTLARHGADIAFTYKRNKDAAGRIQADVESQGRRCLSASLDACDGTAIEEFCDKVERDFGRIDILVNNVGSTQVLPFALLEEKDWDEAVAVNLKSMFLFTKAIVRGMIRRKNGSIVNIGSVGGHRMVEVPVHYATAKAGVTGFTLSLAKELSRYGIRVNEVCPGLIEGGIGTNVSQRQLQEYNRYCAAGRPGKPVEVAEMVAFAASDRASYINAQTLAVDGGL